MLEHYWQQDGCQDRHLGDQEWQHEQRWRARGCKIEPRWHSWAQNSRSGGICGGPGGLLEAILNDVGSKLACLGSCWCYVVHFGQQNDCQDGHLGDQECQDEPRWRPRGCKIELRLHPGLESGSFYINLGVIFDAF